MNKEKDRAVFRIVEKREILQAIKNAKGELRIKEAFDEEV